MLQELGMEGLEERLSSATQNPASPSYKLSRMVSEITQMEVGTAQLGESVQVFCSSMCACNMCGVGVFK